MVAASQDVEACVSYLKSQHIFIDFEEFKYQFSSHPDYPSLLAISYTLAFFNLTNKAFKD